MIRFTVPRRRGFGISRRPCLCFITAAFDGRRASRCLAQNKNPFAFVSYCIYLGGCNTHTSTRCQVNLKNIPKKSFQKNVYFFRLRCIVWDLSRSFLLRLAISIFTVILIYTMAQVNTFTCSVDSCEAALEECEVRGTCHRICPLPQYIVLSCMLGFLAVAVFLRMPIMIKR